MLLNSCSRLIFWSNECDLYSEVAIAIFWIFNTFRILNSYYGVKIVLKFHAVIDWKISFLHLCTVDHKTEQSFKDIIFLFFWLVCTSWNTELAEMLVKFRNYNAPFGKISPPLSPLNRYPTIFSSKLFF